MAPLVLVAPDSFKGTFPAARVADALAAGIEEAGARADRCPVADGGEGTLDVLVAARGGEVRIAPARDPLGRPLPAARWALLDDGATAVVETAEASGLALVDPAERDAEAASTAGTGELIAAAAAAGAREILVAVGGSATTDGGRGAIDAIAAAGGLRGARLAVLCDVTTPFEDAARIYGPQKGAGPAAVERLTARLHALAAQLPRDPRGRPMTGAAGGLSGGLWAAFGARLAPGAAAVLDAVGFDARLAAADAVVAGEGRVDGQSLAGKIVGEIAARARAAGRPLHVVAGTDALDPAQRAALGLASVTAAPTLDAIRAAGRTIAHAVAAQA
ncbi:MAG: glycerate kinase [Solirubrobacteraceae bacterium]|nr:glycerate kinase [Solirubrobacteraceae bacterium]